MFDDFVGKTIESVYYNDLDDNEYVTFTFTDGTTKTIYSYGGCTGGSNCSGLTSC